jgi:hypothetical protein
MLGKMVGWEAYGFTNRDAVTSSSPLIGYHLIRQ